MILKCRGVYKPGSRVRQVGARFKYEAISAHTENVNERLVVNDKDYWSMQSTFEDTA